MPAILQTEMMGVLLIIGSLAFSVAAFMPVSRVFAARVAEHKISIIEADRSGWNVSQIFFALGATTAWIGMGLLAVRTKLWNGSVFPFGAVAVAGIGLFIWLWHLRLRIIRPKDFANGLLPGWHFPVYGFLTLFALFGIGVGMLSSHVPLWLPILNMSLAVMLATAFLVFKDLPPFFFYLVTLVDGIALLILQPF